MPSWRSRIVCGAAVITLLSAGCDPSTSTSPSSGSANRTEDPSRSVAVLPEFAWEKIELPDADGAFVTGLATDGRVAVLIGFTFDPTIESELDMFGSAVWTSSDGREWRRDRLTSAFERSRMMAATAGGPGFVAAALLGVCFPHGCSGLPPNGGTVVWTSRDGTTWDRLPGPTGLENGAVWDMTRTSSGLIAVGYEPDPDKPEDLYEGPATKGAIWTSPDGSTWTAMAGLPEAEQLTKVWTVGSVLYAVGGSQDGLVAWSSQDGTIWRSIASSDERWIDVADVAGDAERLVAVGSDSDVDGGLMGIVYLSDDGATWERTPTQDAFRQAEMQRVLHTDLGFFALGTESGRPDDLPALIWHSPDGSTWTRHDGPAGWDRLQPDNAYRVFDGLLVHGFALDEFGNAGSDRTPEVWYTPLP